MHFSIAILQWTALFFSFLSSVAAISVFANRPSEPIIIEIEPSIDGESTFELPLQIESTSYNSYPPEIRQVRSGTLSFGRKQIVKALRFTGGPVDADYPVCYLVTAPFNEDGGIDFARVGEGRRIESPFTIGEIARSDGATGLLCEAYYINYN